MEGLEPTSMREYRINASHLGPSNRRRAPHFVSLAIAACSLFLLIFPFSALASTVGIEIIHSRDQYPAGDSYPLAFRIQIADPWYIHGTKENGSGLIPTKFHSLESPGLELNEFRFPEPEKRKFEYTKHPVELFSGEILVHARLRVFGDATPLQKVIKGSFSYQACSSMSCMP